MATVYHKETGEVRQCDACDARELIETGRWSREPAESVPVAEESKKRGRPVKVETEGDAG